MPTSKLGELNAVALTETKDTPFILEAIASRYPEAADTAEADTLAHEGLQENTCIQQLAETTAV